MFYKGIENEFWSFHPFTMSASPSFISFNNWELTALGTHSLSVVTAHPVLVALCSQSVISVACSLIFGTQVEHASFLWFRVYGGFFFFLDYLSIYLRECKQRDRDKQTPC